MTNPFSYDIYHGLHNELQAALEQNQAQSVVDTAGKAGLEGLLHEPDNTNPEANLSPEQLEQVDLIREQFKAAHQGFTATRDALAVSGMPASELPYPTEAQLEDELEANLTDWIKNGVIDYILEQKELDPEVEFTLVATPNILANHEQLGAVAKEFGKGQPQKASVYKDLYKLYSAEELCGKRIHSSADPECFAFGRFSLIPSKPTPELGSRPAAEQLEEATKLQAANPGLELTVPSVLSAVSYWYTLRAAGYKLDEIDGAYDRTIIRHFDLEAKRLGGFWFVPDSYVSDGGTPFLEDYNVELGRVTRLAVG